MKNIDTLLVKDMSHSSAKLWSIKAIDASYLISSSVETMRDVFAVCEQAETMIVSDFNISKAKTIRRVFWYDYKLKYLDLSSFILHH